MAAFRKWSWQHSAKSYKNSSKTKIEYLHQYRADLPGPLFSVDSDTRLR
jgi:hypothetical protein